MDEQKVERVFGEEGYLTRTIREKIFTIWKNQRNFGAHRQMGRNFGADEKSGQAPSLSFG